MSNKGCILFVEDEAPVLKTMLKFFSKQGFETYGAQNPEDALDVAKHKMPDIAVLDVMLHESGGGIGEVDGFELCKNLREQGFDKPIIFVNTASKCGFTSQFEGLEKLYSENKDNLLIVGFPSNDFNQELSTDKEIQDFCKLTYAVEFPMMSKSSVIGKNANPLYQELYARTKEAPMWNFYKYVVSPGAKKINVLPSTVSPESKEFRVLIEPYL